MFTLLGFIANNISSGGADIGLDLLQLTLSTNSGPLDYTQPMGISQLSC